MRLMRIFNYKITVCLRAKTERETLLLCTVIYGCIFANIESSLAKCKVHRCIIFMMQLRGDASAAAAIEKSRQRDFSRVGNCG